MRTSPESTAADPRSEAPQGVTLPSAEQIDTWFSGLDVGVGAGTPTVKELQASLSWRVTEPLRAVKARERLSLLKAGKLPIPTHAAPPTALADARRALEQRLRQVAPHLLPGSTPAELRALTLEHLLGRLTFAVHTSGLDSELWLLMIAVGGCFPDQAQLFALRRDLRRVSHRDATARILHHCGVWTSRLHSHLRTIELVHDRPVAFADFTARFGFNSGIQRVTRQTLSHWNGRHRFELAALTADGTALRTLDADERDRVLAWSGDDDSVRADNEPDRDETTVKLIVPWQTTVFVPEVPAGHGTATLTALARFSDNYTIAIGYDTIPVSSGHFVHRSLTLQFVSYLSMLKYFDEVVAISEATNGEFLGFSEALTMQGLPGPKVVTELLPIEHIPADSDALAEADADEPSDSSTGAGLPMVLSVGSNEPRKNQLTVIYASEVLWRQGKQFSLVVLGGRGDKNYTDIPDAVAALRAQGRPIELRRDVDEAHLAQAYRDARFSVFISIQEGYGLPVAESLAVGTPVVTTSYGSTSEIAADGGCLAVDPRDDDRIVETMGRLLDDDDMLAELEAQIEARHDTSWGDYADALWRIVEAGEAQK
ncbi:glycosyltransferase [Subtercola sp. YIM 133946]|uniref:glycosyltransferase n=1 Tax=Subtercola sp. YIM 133946 TaxID=3118909 RepID=UPI002F940AC2